MCICEQCLGYKGKQGKADLYLLLVTYPLELVHMDFLTMKNPCTGADVNILVIIDHLRAMVKAFSNEFIVNYNFPKNLLMDQLCVYIGLNLECVNDTLSSQN